MSKKVKVPKDAKELKKFIKSCAKEIQLIVNPTDKKTKEPIEVAKGSVEKMQKKITACAKTLTTEDELSKELKSLLDHWDIEIADPVKTSDDSNASDLPDEDEIMKMKSGELKDLIKSEKLGIKTTGKKVKELREEVWSVISAKSDDSNASDLPDEDEIDDLDYDDLEDLVNSHDILSDSIDMDDFDEDDEDDLRTEILKIIAAQSDTVTGSKSDEMPEVPEVDEDDPDETHGTLSALVADHDLDIDPDDFDEDEEDEVTSFREKVIEALEEKYPTSDENTAEDLPEMPEKDDIEDDSEAAHEAISKVIAAADLDIDPDDFDEDEEDEVMDLYKKTVKALKKKEKGKSKSSGGSKGGGKKKEPTIVDQINDNSDDFKVLKKIIKGDDIFAKLNDAAKLKKFKKDPEKLAAKMVKLAGKSKGAAGSKESKKKKPGVIDTIVSCIEEAPVTREDILEKMVEIFPDKNPDAMMKTIKVQVPSRIRKEKNSSLTEKKGKYFFKKSENGIKATPK